MGKAKVEYVGRTNGNPGGREIIDECGNPMGVSIVDYIHGRLSRPKYNPSTGRSEIYDSLGTLVGYAYKESRWRFYSK